MRMLKLLCLVPALIAASACDVLGPTADPANSASANVTAPAAGVIDDQAIAIAYEGLNAFSVGVVLAIDAGKLKPGSPNALKIRNGLSTVRDLLNAADDMRRVGNIVGASDALRKARTRMEDLRGLLTAN